MLVSTIYLFLVLTGDIVLQPLPANPGHAGRYRVAWVSMIESAM